MEQHKDSNQEDHGECHYSRQLEEPHFLGILQEFGIENL
jgi:hypothetical protein